MARPLDPSGLPVKKKGEKYVVHVISGTHWDREWRFTAEQSKFRLADLLDTVADTLERVPAYRQFVLDGGSVMLEDYLTIRPGSRERLARLVREGRLALTSWYTLPGINLVAPEAVIRNLQEGRRIADEFGGAMRTGYTATGYGQPSQMPQIYRGFGMEQVTLYRGTNKHAVPPVCRWTGRDGSEVLLIRGFDEVTRSNWVYYAYMPIALGKSGDPVEELEYRYDPRTRPVHMADAQLYEMGFTSLGGEVRVPRSRRALLQGYEHFRGQAYPYAIGKLVLALNMDDNASPWPNQPKLIEALNQVLDDTVILDSTLDDYVQAVVEEVKGTRLREVRGELRYPAVEYGWNGLFGMTASARVRMKQLNEEAETELILVAEPLAVVASLCGAPYPRVSLDAAWLSLLKNHAHDSICGASLDDVHEDMAYRFRHTRTVSEEVSRRSIEAVWNRIDHSGFQADDQTLTVFNSLPYARAGVHPFVLDLPADVFRNETYRHTPLGYPDPDLFDVLDEQGRPVDYEITDIQDIQIGYESPAESPGAYLKVKRHRVLLPVSLPSSGYRSFAVRKRPPRYVPRPRPRPPRPNIAHPGGILENRFLRVEIRANGAFDLTDRMRGRVFPNLHSFDDRISTMRYAHMEPPAFGDEAVTSLGAQAQITMLESNPLRGRYRI